MAKKATEQLEPVAWVNIRKAANGYILEAYNAEGEPATKDRVAGTFTGAICELRKLLEGND